MTWADEPWARLLEEHSQNTERLAGEQASPHSWGLFLLGLAVPFIGLGAVWADRDVVFGVAVVAVASFPIGLACLFVERARLLGVGLLLGTAAAGFVGQAVLL